MALVANLVSHLKGISWTDATLAAAPPPPAAENAAKGLRRLCEQAVKPDASNEQARLGRDAIEALLAAGAGDTESSPRVLCSVVSVATGAIDAIDRQTAADTAECGERATANFRALVPGAGCRAPAPPRALPRP